MLNENVVKLLKEGMWDLATCAMVSRMWFGSIQRCYG